MSRLSDRVISHMNRMGNPGDPVVIFDIDSTLMDTAPRNRAILVDSARVFPFVASYLPLLGENEMGWNFLEPLEMAGLRDEEKLKALRQFWEERFFTDSYVLKDRPYPGAASLLKELQSQGIKLIYLTGRHVDGMKKGTIKSFISAGFPVEKEEHFFFKPDFAMEDKNFKENACLEIKETGTVIATFDNEPGNCNLFHKAFSDSLHFRLDTISSPHPEPLDEGIETIRGFE